MKIGAKSLCQFLFLVTHIAVDIDTRDSFFLLIKNYHLHCGLEGQWTCETRPALTCSELRGNISGESWTTCETLAPKHRNTDSSTGPTFPLPFYFFFNCFSSCYKSSLLSMFSHIKYCIYSWFASLHQSISKQMNFLWIITYTSGDIISRMKFLSCLFLSL